MDFNDDLLIVNDLSAKRSLNSAHSILAVKVMPDGVICSERSLRDKLYAGIEKERYRKYLKILPLRDSTTTRLRVLSNQT